MNPDSEMSAFVDQGSSASNESKNSVNFGSTKTDRTTIVPIAMMKMTDG